MDSAFRRSYAAVEEALTQTLEHEAGRDADTLADEIWAVARAVEGSAVLRRGLADPSREGEDKAALADRLFSGKIGLGALYLTKAVASQRWSSPTELISALDRVGVETLLAHAERHGRTAQVEDELFRFSRIVSGTPDLQSALSDRRATPEARRSLVESLLAGKATAETVRLAQQAVAGTLGRRPDRVLEAYLEQAAERQDRVTATVTSAAPLTDEQLRTLADALSRQYGRAVSTNVVIDEDVIGGIRVEIGDEVIDGTVSHRLADARRRMTS